MGEAYTENCAGRKEFAAPESWYSFEVLIEIDEGFNVHRHRAREAALPSAFYPALDPLANPV